MTKYPQLITSAPCDLMLLDEHGDSARQQKMAALKQATTLNMDEKRVLREYEQEKHWWHVVKNDKRTGYQRICEESCMELIESIVTSGKYNLQTLITNGVSFGEWNARILNLRLYEAIKKGSWDEMNKLLRYGAQLQKCTPEHTNIFIELARWNKIATVQRILANAQYATTQFVHVSDGTEVENVLHIAISQNSDMKLSQFIRYMCNIAPHMLEMQDEKGNTPLHIAISNADDEEVYALLEHKNMYGQAYGINAKNHLGETAIMLAISERRSLKMIKHMVECGAHLHVQDKQGDTVLHRLAYQLDQSEQNQDYERQDIDGNDSDTMEADVLERITAVAEYLIQMNATQVTHANSQLSTPLHIAADVGSMAFVHLLIKHVAANADEYVNLQDKNGRTALHYAAASGRFQMAHYLLNVGANAGILDKAKRTCLMMAIQEGYFKCAYLIHRRGLRLLNKQ